jgi:hypothetical protein
LSRGAEAQAALARAGRWLARRLGEPPLPQLAVEVRPRAVAAVRLATEGGQPRLAAAAVTELPAGVLDVTLTRPNVLEPAAFRAALRATLERVGALSGGAVSLVLPDPAARVALVPATGLRGREAKETVRFRLHKALPFDVRSSRLSWAVIPGGEQALVAVAPEDVVRGYEQPLEELGFHPGLVEVSSLALVDALADETEPAGDRLLVNWDSGYVSFVLLRGRQPLLIRTLPGEDGAEAVARQATGTLQFHRDRLGGGTLAEAVVRAAALPGEDALRLLSRVLPVPPRLVSPWERVGGDDRGAEAQALAAAAASALRSAA